MALTLIDSKLQLNGTTHGWWVMEFGGKVWNIISQALTPDSGIPPKWDGLTRGKVYDILDEGGQYVLTVPRLMDAEPNIRFLRSPWPKFYG